LNSREVPFGMSDTKILSIFGGFALLLTVTTIAFVLELLCQRLIGIGHLQDSIFHRAFIALVKASSMVSMALSNIWHRFLVRNRN